MRNAECGMRNAECVVAVYEVERIEDPEVWDGLVRAAPGATVFSTSSWLRCARDVFGGEGVFYGCYRKGNLVAGCSGLALRRAGLAKLTTPPLTPYGGVVHAPIAAKRPAKIEAEQSGATCALMDRLTSDFHYVQLSHAPILRDVREFLWRDWRVSIRYSYRMDLTDLDRLWDRFENRTNTVIRKAERSGCAVRLCEDLDLFALQYDRIYREQGTVSLVSGLQVAAFCRAVRDVGLSRMYVAESPAGEPACLVVFVLGFDTVYAWVSGAEPRLNATGATSLLYWRVLQEMAEQYCRFDFVGANLPPVAKFKRGFGGDLIPYFTTERYSSSFARGAFLLGQRARGAARSLRRAGRM